VWIVIRRGVPMPIGAGRHRSTRHWRGHDPDLWNCPTLEALAGLVPTPSVRKEKPRTERSSLIATLRLRSLVRK
jgi:hypothetical protein